MSEQVKESIIAFAETRFRNQHRRFGIKLDDRRRHMYLVGKTGMGKSTLLENMIIADMRAGHGLAVVDPHGDLAEKILNFVPNDRINDVIYFNPADTKYPVAFNILESVGPDYKHLIAYGLVGVFKKIWADSWGPRMEYIMTNTILALLDYPGSTLLGLMRMLVDKQYRKKVIDKVTDPVVKTFWTDEFSNYSEKFRTEAIAPIQNKVGQFLSSSIIRNIVGQSKSTIEMRQIMDNKKILIMNLAKGRVGEENSALLGAMMITRLQIAAMSRVNIPENERNDFFLYVDEFQNFATDSFASILSEARKYRLCLIMAHQYIEQLGDVVKPAVFGNVGTMIVFRVGAADALELEPEFTPQFLAQDIVNLPKYAFCLRLMIDGIATDPFSAMGLPPATGRTDNGEKVIKVSRERYAHPQDQVEDRIIKWSGVEINRPKINQASNAELGKIEEKDNEPIEDSVVEQAQEKSEEVVQLDVLPTVNPLHFILGVKPEAKPAVKAKEIILEPEEPASEENEIPAKPKINFVKQLTQPPAPARTTELARVSAPTIPVIQPKPETVIEQVKPAVVNPVRNSAKLVADKKEAVISLSALKQGNVPKVNFGKNKQPSRPVFSQQQPVKDAKPRPVTAQTKPVNNANNKYKVNIKDLL